MNTLKWKHISALVVLAAGLVLVTGQQLFHFVNSDKQFGGE